MDYVWLPCSIENAGFDSERRFEVELPGGDGKVVGVAYIAHLRHGEDRPILEGEPPYGEKVSGEVKCRIIKKFGQSISIEFPGTEVFHVPQEAINSFR